MILPKLKALKQMLINEVKGKNDNRIGSIRRIDKFEKKKQYQW
ncbi:hypothetical protein bcere0029_26930 [Bacillus cereus AH1272]|nr:hypothetical protein bcere0029_26930 [Bacillus cereus AH1272]EEL93243.1 hypothetical protein bcere0030_27230 [Bacillus cereus AH1273]